MFDYYHYYFTLFNKGQSRKTTRQNAEIMEQSCIAWSFPAKFRADQATPIKRQLAWTRQ